MSFIEEIKKRAKSNLKTIVLPEATDRRVLTAAATALHEAYANIVLLGDEKEIQKLANQNNLNIERAKLINPKTSSQQKRFAENLYELRKAKGLTLEKAQELVLDEVYYGMMMVKMNEADGLVSRSCSFNF